jgi:hypothetical protein
MVLSTGHSPVDNMSSTNLTFEAELENFQRGSFNYFLHETNLANGLVIDKTEADWPVSIAASGMRRTGFVGG